MNYLAHAFLSFQNPPRLVGNMISDFVKGKQKEQYEVEIQQGIELHRALDRFTDNHAALLPAKNLFKPAYRLYAGAFIDVVLDYFLAIELENKLEFLTFTKKVYTDLEMYTSVFPNTFAKMFPSMQEHNWLYNYQYDWAMQKSFTGLMRRATYITEIDTAFSIFQKEKEILENCFQHFWKDAFLFAQETYKNITNVLPTQYNYIT